MKNLITLLFVVLMSITICPLYGQSPPFQQIYAAQVDQSGKDVIEIPSGYLIAAMNEKVQGDTDIYILKTDLLGDTIMTNVFGGNMPDYPNCIIATNDGNYFIVGFTKSYGMGSYDVWLLKVDPQCQLIWSKTFGGTGDDVGKSIIPTFDGNFIIVGRSDGPGNQGYDVFLLKIDPSGNIIWQHNYGGMQFENARSAVECSDGGIAVIGQTMSYGLGNGDIYFFKTDSVGNLLWQKIFGGSLTDDGNDMVLNSDGTFILCGETNSFGNGDIDVWVIKTDQNGNWIWDYTYGGTDKDVSKTIETTTDGGYIIGAISRSWGWINPDMWLVKIDATGLQQWTRHFGSWDHEHCYAVRQVSDGGYISIGHTKSYGPVSRIMFIKLDQNGTNEVFDNEELIKFDIYPNPNLSKGELLIRNNLSFSSDLIFDLYSTTGIKIMSCHVKPENVQDEFKVKLPDLAAGIYLYSLSGANVNSAGKLLIGLTN